MRIEDLSTIADDRRLEENCGQLQNRAVVVYHQLLSAAETSRVVKKHVEAAKSIAVLLSSMYYNSCILYIFLKGTLT
jgi:hypothetical protein